MLFSAVRLFENPLSEAKLGRITCIEAYESFIFLGTSLGHVVLVEAADLTSPSPQITIRVLGKKPIMSLSIVDHHLLVLCADNQLHVVNIISFEPVPILSLKGILGVYVDLNDVCMIKRKVAALCRFNSQAQKWVVVRELTINDSNLSKAVMAGGSLCYATGSMYGVLNLETGRSVELFPYDANSVYPLMVAIQNTEYLIVNGTTESAIGIFITGKGEPTRGTIPFPSYPLGIAFKHPYLLSLHTDSKIHVFSILDQKLVQTLDFTLIELPPQPTVVERTGLSLSRPSSAPRPQTPRQKYPNARLSNIFGYRNLMASSSLMEEAQGLVASLVACDGKTYYALEMLSVETQVLHRITDGQVDQALELARTSLASDFDLNGLPTTPAGRRLCSRAGWAYLRNGDLKRAFELFQYAREDPCQFLSLVNLFSSLESRIVSSLSNTKEKESDELSELVSSPDGLSELLQYLTHYRSKGYENEYPHVTDTMTLLLMACLDRRKDLLELVQNKNAALIEEVERTLRERGFNYALSLLYQRDKESNRVLDIWKKIVDGILVDESFPGLSIFVPYMKGIGMDSETYLDYARWILRHELSLMLDLFEDVSLDENAVLLLLKEFDNSLIIAYLENRVFDKASKLQVHHDELLSCFTKSIKKYGSLEVSRKLLKEFIAASATVESGKPPSFTQYLQQQSIHSANGEYLKARVGLLRFLEASNLYDKEALLNSLESSFIAEKAIILGKLKRYDQVLKLLVLDLQDTSGAEEYCLAHASVEPKLLMNLFQLHLEHASPEIRMKRTVELLTRHPDKFEITDVLGRLPKNWSIGLLAPYLTKAMRLHQIRARELCLVRNLAKTVNLNTNVGWISMQNKAAVRFSRESPPHCSVCGNTIDASQFFAASYASNPGSGNSPQLIHLACMDRWKVMEADRKAAQRLRGGVTR